MTAPSAPTVAAVPAHPAYLVLYQRPQPKPLSVPPVQGASTSASRVPLRDIWRAGGYDPLNHTRKNWREVVTTVPVTVASIENEHSQHLCIPSRSKCIHERMNSHSSSAMEVDDSNNLWTSHIFESDLLFSHLSSGTVVTDFGGHIPVSWV